MTTTYTIETQRDGQWTSYGIGDATGYETREAAEAAIECLLATCTTPDWHDSNYRIVEVQS